MSDNQNDAGVPLHVPSNVPTSSERRERLLTYLAQAGNKPWLSELADDYRAQAAEVQRLRAVIEDVRLAASNSIRSDKALIDGVALDSPTRNEDVRHFTGRIQGNANMIADLDRRLKEPR